MLKSGVLKRALEDIDSSFKQGVFEKRLAPLVACPTENPDPSDPNIYQQYLDDHIRPWLEKLGYQIEIYPNPIENKPPFLIAKRIEDPDLSTALTFAHGDVVAGKEEEWSEGLSPWKLALKDDNYYGRGTADNKGQHVINLMALEAVLKERGNLGFNSTILFEMGEETGSPGLREFCETHKELLQADVFISSDGPRLAADKPLIYLGTRGFLTLKFHLVLERGKLHPGNWGGIVRDPHTVMANAIASVVDERGRFQIPEFKPDSLTPDIKEALAKLNLADIEASADPNWGEEDQSLVERLLGWNSLTVLNMGNAPVTEPQRSIDNESHAICQLRYVVGTDVDRLVGALREHFGQNAAFQDIKVEASKGSYPATRTDPDNPWVRRIAQSIKSVTGKTPDLEPNLPGNLPNDAFAITLGLPTIWVPHSHPGSNQHAPDEHIPAACAQEALQIMTGVFWDLGETEKHSVPSSTL